MWFCEIILVSVQKDLDFVVFDKVHFRCFWMTCCLQKAEDPITCSESVHFKLLCPATAHNSINCREPIKRRCSNILRNVSAQELPVTHHVSYKMATGLAPRQNFKSFLIFKNFVYTSGRVYIARSSQCVLPPFHLFSLLFRCDGFKVSFDLNSWKAYGPVFVFYLKIYAIPRYESKTHDDFTLQAHHESIIELDGSI